MRDHNFRLLLPAALLHRWSLPPMPLAFLLPVRPFLLSVWWPPSYPIRHGFNVTNSLSPSVVAHLMDDLLSQQSFQSSLLLVIALTTFDSSTLWGLWVSPTFHPLALRSYGSGIGSFSSSSLQICPMLGTYYAGLELCLLKHRC